MNPHCAVGMGRDESALALCMGRDKGLHCTVNTKEVSGGAFRRRTVREVRTGHAFEGDFRIMAHLCISQPPWSKQAVCYSYHNNVPPLRRFQSNGVIGQLGDVWNCAPESVLLPRLMAHSMFPQEQNQSLL